MFNCGLRLTGSVFLLGGERHNHELLQQSNKEARGTILESVFLGRVGKTPCARKLFSLHFGNKGTFLVFIDNHYLNNNYIIKF